MTYPWLEHAMADFIGHSAKLPEAVLITGIEGIGKFHLANMIAQSLLCRDVNNAPGCGRCQTCNLFMSGNHPDYHLLTNEYMTQTSEHPLISIGERYFPKADRSNTSRKLPKRVIGVEQVRQLTLELLNSSHLGAAKVAIIYPAEELNLNAANALLKTLEEPSQNTYFFLVTASPHLLPATIRSRCIEYKVPTPSLDQSVSWLEKSHSINREQAEDLLAFFLGSPLKASTSFLDDSWSVGISIRADIEKIVSDTLSVVQASEKWGQIDPQASLRWLQQELRNSFRYSVGVPSTKMGELLYERLGRDICLEIYAKVGEFLMWPRRSVDERLFLEWVFGKFSRGGEKIDDRS